MNHALAVSALIGSILDNDHVACLNYDMPYCVIDCGEGRPIYMYTPDWRSHDMRECIEYGIAKSRSQYITCHG